MREPMVGLPGGMGFGCHVMTTGNHARRNLAEIAAEAGELPEGFHLYGEIRVNGERVRHYDDEGRDVWAMIRPKAGVVVQFFFPMQGGKIGKILSLVATVALVAIGIFISSGGLVPFLGPLFAAGSIGANLLALGIGILGRLAISALSPPAGKDKNDGGGNQAPVLGNAGADGNVLSPNGPILRVCGVDVKTYPPLAAPPLVDLLGDDEYVEASYIMAGPHRQDDIRIEDAKIEEIDDLQFFTDDGTSSKPNSLLYRRGIQRIVNFELVGHRRSKTVLHQLQHQANPDLDLPQPRIEVSRFDPDEIWLHLIWPNGMTDSANNGFYAMPFRLRMRILGGTVWIKLPELWFQSNRTGTVRKSIKLIWDATPPVNPDTADTNGAWQSIHTSPGWVAQAGFIGTPGVRNATLRVYREYQGFTVYLDPAVFARGNKWEVEITRGEMAAASLFNPATYNYGAGTTNFFSYFTSGAEYWAPGTNIDNLFTASLINQAQILRFASVKNQPPVSKTGHARIEIRAKNVQVSRLSTKASGLVPLWNGIEWTGNFVSDNPADHFRYVAADVLTRDPVEPDALDNTKILAWRAQCQAKSYKIAAAFDGRPWSETLKAIASTGYGRVKPGEKLGVAFDYDRSAEAPKQPFSARNANGFTLLKNFDPPPDAIRVTFRNRDINHDPDERLVIRPGLKIEDLKQIESADAIGLDTPAAIDARFGYDLEAAYLRDHNLSFEAPSNAMVAEMGDLVEINHTFLDRRTGAARVRNVRRNTSNQVTAIDIDAPVALGNPTSLHLIANLAAEDDLSLLGTPFAAVAETPTGILTFPLTHTRGETMTLTLTTPTVSSDLSVGNHVGVGPSLEEKGRYIVMGIEPTRRFSARITCVPEAPELWQ